MCGVTMVHVKCCPSTVYLRRVCGVTMVHVKCCPSTVYLRRVCVVNYGA